MEDVGEVMKKRVISSIVMLLIVVPIILAGNEVFSLGLAVIAILALKEFLDLRKSHNKIPSALSLFSVLALLGIVFYEYQGGLVSYSISHRLLILILMVYLLPTLFISKNKYETKDAFYLFAVVILLGMAFHSMIVIRNESIYLFAYLVLIPIITDTTAFIVGTLIGKRKIAPLISPSKTIAGSISGSIVATCLCSCFYCLLVSDANILITVIVSLILSIMGQLGDLLFSKIKRENDIKDYSNLIPGHGGVLDRIDSFIFVILIYYVFLKII